MMKLIGAVLCVGVACSDGLVAQISETETKSKITVEDGKDVLVTGCVAPALGGKGFILTNVADKKGALHNYKLVSADSELSKHVGHRVQLSGKVTDQGDAKITVETKVKTRVEPGDDKETRGKAHVEGDEVGNYLGVKSVKMIAAICP